MYYSIIFVLINFLIFNEIFNSLENYINRKSPILKIKKFGSKIIRPNNKYII